MLNYKKFIVLEDGRKYISNIKLGTLLSIPAEAILGWAFGYRKEMLETEIEKRWNDVILNENEALLSAEALVFFPLNNPTPKENKILSDLIEELFDDGHPAVYRYMELKHDPKYFNIILLKVFLMTEHDFRRIFWLSYDIDIKEVCTPIGKTLYERAEKLVIKGVKDGLTIKEIADSIKNEGADPYDTITLRGENWEAYLK